MRIVVVVEARFARTPDGAVWSREGTAGFFARYLSAFDRVRVVARVGETSAVTGDANRVDCDAVEVWPVPYYLGPRQYVLRRAAVAAAVCAAAGAGDAVIVRTPSPIGAHLVRSRRRAGLPFALEVVGDPHDVLAPGVIRHPLRPFLRPQQTRVLRDQCRTAAAVAYVTEQHLQTRYPPAATAATASYSSVDLPPAAFRAGPRGLAPLTAGPTIVSVGSLEQPYKGIDVLIRAVAELHDSGLSVRLAHVGDGRLRPRLAQLCAELGVDGLVEFTGALSGEAVRRRLDAADLLVMPSRTEGLPRALLEAMARGLPAIATAVGGIPELLAPADLVAPGDAEGLAAAIRSRLTDPWWLADASARNLARAREYSQAELAGRRDAFYAAVRDCSGTHAGNSSDRTASKSRLTSS